MPRRALLDTMPTLPLREQFHDAARIAILPMAFCHPGSGALPPRPECALSWRPS